MHFICTNPPGSGSDILVRYFAEKIQQVSGRTVLVENKPGAGGNIAMEYVARSKPDGHTLLVHSASAVAASMGLYKRPPFPDAGKAIAVAATINRQPFMLIVDAKSPFKTLAELTAAMRIKGDKATYGTQSPFGTVMGEFYKVASGTKAVEVGYRTAADSLNDLASGSLDYATADPVFSLAQRRAGRVRVLGVSTGERVQAAPDLPTMAEQGIAMDLTGWWAAMAPGETPRSALEILNKWFVEVVSSDETKAFLNKFGGDPLIETPAVAQAHLVKDVEKWKEYIRVAKIKPVG
jgi:tripartite-type tricarboxylate transporter receptor subunit TctC